MHTCGNATLIIEKDDRPIIVSIIQNSENIDKEKAFKLLSDIYYLESCN